ncbi:hypothetical protein MTO96_045795 [Rhipicephalus appendiculatus]
MKSGAPADDVLDDSTKWIFFTRLMFLKVTMEGRRTSGILEPLPARATAPSDEQTSEQLLEGIYTEKEVSTCQVIDPREVATRQSCGDASVCPPPQKKKKPRPSKYDEEIEGLSKFITEKPDEHERFGAFLAEKMIRVPSHLIDVMQVQLLQTITQYTGEATVVESTD